MADRTAVDVRRPGAAMTIERDGFVAGGSRARRARRRDRRGRVHSIDSGRDRGSTSSRSVATIGTAGSRARCCRSRSSRSFDRGYARHVALDRFRPERIDALRARRHADPRVLHASRDRSLSLWRWPRDSNPRESCPPTRFPGASLRPLGQATATSLAGGPAAPSAASRPSDAAVEQRGVLVPPDRTQVISVAVEPRAVVPADAVPVDHRRVVVAMRARVEARVVRVRDRDAGP